MEIKNHKTGQVHKIAINSLWILQNSARVTAFCRDMFTLCGARMNEAYDESDVSSKMAENLGVFAVAVATATQLVCETATPRIDERDIDAIYPNKRDIVVDLMHAVIGFIGAPVEQIDPKVHAPRPAGQE